MTRQGLLVLGNQLFAPSWWRGESFVDVFMREDKELCTYYKFHQQKITFFLAAMRTYARELRALGVSVTYQQLSRDGGSYEDHLVAWVRAKKIERLILFEVEDAFFAERLRTRLKAEGVSGVVWQSPMFVTSRAQFKAYLADHKRPLMRTFYQQQRLRHDILLEGGKAPRGGKWSFDELNRQPLPAAVPVPAVPAVPFTAQMHEVARLCGEHFADHPGQASALWLPVCRAGAEAWLQTFLHQRLGQFGPYEDALTERSDTVFHSVLTPFLNVGLLTPKAVLDAALAFAHKHPVPLASLEGFVRQVLGWREFMRGIYHNFDARMQDHNHFGHTRKLTAAWYAAQTGVPPLDAVLSKVVRLGYAHHIERLMVVGSLMLLLEVDPKQAHRWFMEMFIDSSDWVMGPNVYGMALHSDGGIFATQPYICGSNYYRKMGGYRPGPWCDGVDGLYWGFVAKHRQALQKNVRMANRVRGLDRIGAERRARLEVAAQGLRDKLTVPA